MHQELQNTSSCPTTNLRYTSEAQKIKLCCGTGNGRWRSLPALHILVSTQSPLNSASNWPQKTHHEVQHGHWPHNLKKKRLSGPKSDEQVKPGSAPEKTAGNRVRLVQKLDILSMSSAWEEGKYGEKKRLKSAAMGKIHSCFGPQENSRSLGAWG